MTFVAVPICFLTRILDIKPRAPEIQPICLGRQLLSDSYEVLCNSCVSPYLNNTAVPLNNLLNYRGNCRLFNGCLLVNSFINTAFDE
ncbi:Uncharacterized protein HZ326_16798 [Fusarium oxysporum f. sp. albedinis]|jgi:hypothetical protein|nr:Uncharacterized protein HZ326_16798 [Fusarium oxysporum f. sp. albedinis]